MEHMEVILGELALMATYFLIKMVECKLFLLSSNHVLTCRRATCYPSCTTSRNVFGGTSQVLVQTWQTYYNQADITPIPICGISQNICLGTCNLECSSEGQILIWSFCGTKVLESGQRYTLDVLSWSTVVAPDCIEVEIRIIDEPKDWGNQTYSQTGIYKDCDDVLGD